MVYAFTQDVPLDEPTYRRVIQELGDTPLRGLLLHLCIRRPDGGLRYIDVWESEKLCAQAFENRIHSAVDAAFGGTRPSTEPEVVVLDVIDITGIVVSA